MSKIEETLEVAEELYKYGIKNDNEFVEEKSKLLIRNLVILSEIKNNIINTYELKDFSSEIAKVKRKVPKWMKKTHQANYKILKAYMDLSNNNENPLNIDKLEEYVDMGRTFLGHYNGMKTISEKNHGKVFDEINREVELWEPVAEFIEGLFMKKDCKAHMLNIESDFKRFALGTVANESTIDGYVKSLTEDIPSKLNMDSVFTVMDINSLQKIYDRCSIDGNLYDWNRSIGRGRPMASIKKYINFLKEKESINR